MRRYLRLIISTVSLEKKEVNRPGLQLTGFFDHFDPLRIQIVGKVEYHYLLNLSPQKRLEAIEGLLSKHIVCLVITSGLEVFDEFYETAKKYNTPVLRTTDTTSNFMGSLAVRKPCRENDSPRRFCGVLR